LVIVIKIDLSGAAFEETDAGGVTESTSGGFCLVAKMKNDNNKKSHVAHSRHVDGGTFARYFNFGHV